jgi:hypothetical protein
MMLKVMVWYCMIDIHQLMAALSIFVFVLVWPDLTQHLVSLTCFCEYSLCNHGVRGKQLCMSMLSIKSLDQPLIDSWHAYSNDGP